MMGPHGYGTRVTDRLGSRCCIVTKGLLTLAPKSQVLFPLPMCVMTSHIWPFCGVKDILTTATITKRMILHICMLRDHLEPENQKPATGECQLEIYMEGTPQVVERNGV